MHETADGYSGVATMVTGAQGFIGCWLVEGLLDAGAEVVAPLRNLVPGSRFRAEGVEQRCRVVEADVLDTDALTRSITEHEVRSVFHLAGQPIVGVANRSPHSTYETNIRGTWSVLEACRAASLDGIEVERIVVASSDHAYGTHETLPYREDFAFDAEFPYDVSKACTDLIARSYATTYGLPVAVTRMANTYGGGDLNWSRIVPDSTRSLIRGRRPVIRSDGTPERDYLYIADAVDAYLAVGRSLDDDAMHGRAWNVGLGRGVSVLELVNTLIEVSGVDVEPDIRGTVTPPAEIDRQYLDATAIRSELGWQANWDLRAGLQATFEWYAAHLDAAAATPA